MMSCAHGAWKLELLVAEDRFRDMVRPDVDVGARGRRHVDLGKIEPDVSQERFELDGHRRLVLTLRNACCSI